MGFGGTADLGRMIRQQQRAADQRRDRNAGRRGSTRRGEALKTVPGDAACVECGELWPRAEMLMTDAGPCCDSCEDTGDAERLVQRGLWATNAFLGSSTVVLTGAIAAIPWGLTVNQPGSVATGLVVMLSILGAIGMFLGPFLGPLALFNGLAEERQLRSLAEAAAPSVVRGFWLHRGLAILNGLGGLSLGTLSVGMWVYVVWLG